MKARALFVDHVGVLGGAELALLDVARAYHRTSTFVLFADGPFKGRLEDLGIRVRVLEGGRALHSIRRETSYPSPKAGFRVLALAWRLAKLARGHDLLHANSQKALVVACLAGAIARRPVIWDLNDLVTPEHFSRTNIRVDVFLANYFVDRVIANSRASAEALVAQGARGDHVRVVYNGLDPAPFDRVSDEAIARARRDLGIPDGARLVGLFGRLASWKGQHIAVRALAELPGVHLLLVGDALFGESDYKASLQSIVAELGLEGRVHFLGFRSDIPTLMRLVDVVLHTSIAPEPFGRVIVEGMLARRPVIATRAGGVGEIIDDGETGVLVQPNDFVPLARAIATLLFDSVAAQRLAARGRAAAEARFTVGAMVREMSRNMEEVAVR